MEHKTTSRRQESSKTREYHKQHRSEGSGWYSSSGYEYERTEQQVRKWKYTRHNQLRNTSGRSQYSGSEKEEDGEEDERRESYCCERHGEI